MENKDVFIRGLDEKALPAFKAYIREQDWLQSLIQHKNGRGTKGATFFAIRDDYVNIYGHGGSLVKLTYNPSTNKIVGETHFKYLLRKKLSNGKFYVPIIEGKPRFDAGSLADMFVDSLDDGRLLLDQARLYAGEEKFGVHQLVMTNPNVLDIEIVFGKDTGEDEDGTGTNTVDVKKGNKNDRVDFCALRKGDKGKLKIVFYEAKHISNTELKGKVLVQLKRYRKQLQDRKGQILQSYHLVCKNIIELCDGTKIDIPFLEFAKKVVENSQNLTIDPEPRLVIFGYDSVQEKGLLQEIKETLIVGGLDKKHILCRGNPDAPWTGVKFE